MYPGKPAPIKCEVEEAVAGGVLKWKVGATYLEPLDSPTQDEDYEDLLTHEIQFVPKKEVRGDTFLIAFNFFIDSLLSQYNGKSLACEYWVSGQRYSDAITLDLFSLEVITGPSVSPAVVEEGGGASLSLVASIFPLAGTEVTWTVEDSGARELTRLGPGDTSGDGQYTAGEIQVGEEAKKYSC